VTDEQPAEIAFTVKLALRHVTPGGYVLDETEMVETLRDRAPAGQDPATWERPTALDFSGTTWGQPWRARLKFPDDIRDGDTFTVEHDVLAEPATVEEQDVRRDDTGRLAGVTRRAYRVPGKRAAA
jgi:hypothetical protein